MFTHRPACPVYEHIEYHETTTTMFTTANMSNTTTISNTTTMSNTNTMITMTTMTMATMRKVEVVHKEVGSYLTRCARIAALIALNDES